MNKILVLAFVLGLISCENNSEKENLETLNKKSAREVILSTQTSGDTVFHITKQIIWFNNEQIATAIDTVVTLKKENTWETSQDSTTSLDKIPIYVTIQ